MKYGVWAWCAFVSCAAPTIVQAQGFGLNEIGTCAVGRGQAVTGAPCSDASVIYWNPAATTSLQGWSIYAGVALIGVSGDFTSDSSGGTFKGDIPLQVPPHLFIDYTPPKSSWAFGLGVYVPYGLTSQWNDDFPGKFEALKASLTTFYVQPNVAFKINKNWSVGGGPVFGFSSVELQQALDLSQQSVQGISFAQLGIAPGTEFARAKISGSATAVGFNVGVHGHIAADWEVGARYLSALTFDYSDATATFTQSPTGLILSDGNPLGLPGGTPVDVVLAGQFQQGGPLTTQQVSTKITHPAQFQVGVGYTGFTNTTVSADFVTVHWSSFDQIPITFKSATGPPSDTLLENYSDSWGIRFGVEHAFSAGWRGRAGFSYLHSPASDETVTALLPDMDRRNYTLGAGLPIGSRYVLDLAYLHLDTSGRRGRTASRTTTENTDATADELNSGFYTLSANIFSLSLKASF